MLLAARARDCITGCFRLFDTPLRRQGRSEQKIPYQTKLYKRKLRPDPLNAAPPPQQQQGAPKRPWGPNPMELTTKMTPTHSYLFSILLTWKAISLPRDHSPGLLLRHTLKPPMSLKLLGIYTNPMPQHQGGQVTTQGPTPVQTNPGPSASANTIRACTAARREMPMRPPPVLNVTLIGNVGDAKHAQDGSSAKKVGRTFSSDLGAAVGVGSCVTLKVGMGYFTKEVAPAVNYTNHRHSELRLVSKQAVVQSLLRSGSFRSRVKAIPFDSYPAVNEVRDGLRGRDLGFGIITPRNSGEWRKVKLTVGGKWASPTSTIVYGTKGSAIKRQNRFGSLAL
ncbi:hypothetical protein D5086_017483 [Populus alba]|uniref:Uncharacterized protein n=1 Tax=Populus alba TaxID=43335 RepID=A0ACC4BNN2_POPAL